MLTFRLDAAAAKALIHVILIRKRYRKRYIPRSILRYTHGQRNLRYGWFLALRFR